MMDKIWKNRWVCAPEFADLKPIQTLHGQYDTSYVKEEHKEELKNVHTLYRKEIVFSEPPKKVFLDITADDYYKLFINGKFVTQGPAQSYAFCYYYNHLDVSEYLHAGKNVIGVHVYYQGLINRAYNSGDYRQGLIAEMYADGISVIDDRWKCTRAKEYSATHTFGYETQYNEIIDNRQKIIGWKETGFDDSHWTDAVPRVEDDHELLLQPTLNVVQEDVFPVSIESKKNGCLIDFGQQITGTFYMEAEGKQGDQIQILFGEELKEDGEVRSDLRCNCLYEDGLVLAEGINELEQFEYKCFRYVQLKTDAEVTTCDYKVNYRHYPLNEAYCPCPSEDDLVKAIWEIGKNAIINCTQEVFVDCPHREKAQYSGDMTIEAHSFSYLFGDLSMFKKGILDFAHSAKVCKGLMGVAPGSFMQEIADFSLCFPYQVLLYYDLTKDNEFLKQMVPVTEDLIEYFSQYAREDGLLENVTGKWNIVDWPANLRDDYDFDISDVIPGEGCHNVINAMYVGAYICLEKMKDIAGIPYESYAEALKKSFVKAFYCESTGLFVDSTVSNHSSLHANAYALFYDLAPEGHHIVELIQEKGFSCGLFIAYFVLYGLLRSGNKKLAFELITNRTEHSWYNMLSEGATTGYEAWGKEQKWNTSLCHGWASLPIPVLIDMQNQDWRFVLDKSEKREK